jgi:hypothetical protein
MSCICRPIGNALDALSIQINRIRPFWRGKLVFTMYVVVPLAIGRGTKQLCDALNDSQEAETRTIGTSIAVAMVSFGFLLRRFGWLRHPVALAPMPTKGTVLRLVDEINNPALAESYREETRTLVREMIDVRLLPPEQIRTVTIPGCPFECCSIHYFDEVRAAVFEKLEESDNEDRTAIPTLLREGVDAPLLTESASVVEIPSES